MRGRVVFLTLALLSLAAIAAEAPVQPGVYVTEGGWGVLKVVRAKNGATTFDIEAMGGNAKNVEAVVSLVKTMTQSKLHLQPGNQEYAKAFQTMDTMLSRGWNAAKQGMFQGKTDVLTVRQSKMDLSREAKAAGKTQTQLEEAAAGKAAFDMGDAYEDLLGILTALRQSGTPMERLLAKAVRESLYNADNAPTLSFITEGKSRYDPTTHTVYLSKTASPAVILHEALHAALQRYVYENPKSATVQAMVRSLERVLAYKGELTGAAKDVQTLLQGLAAKGEKMDAVLELISYGNTLNEFRTALQNMELRGAPKTFLDAVSSLWNSIVNAVRAMLGSQRSVASDVVMDTLKLLREAELAKSSGKRGGNVLEAAITSDKAMRTSTGITAADYRAFNKANEGVFSTKLLFDAMAWDKLAASFGQNATKIADRIRKEYPRLERYITYINSRFSVGAPASSAKYKRVFFISPPLVVISNSRRPCRCRCRRTPACVR